MIRESYTDFSGVVVVMCLMVMQQLLYLYRVKAELGFRSGFAG